MFLKSVNYLIFFFVLLTIFTFPLERIFDWEEYRLLWGLKNSGLSRILFGQDGYIPRSLISSFAMKSSIHLFGTSLQYYRIFSQVIGALTLFFLVRVFSRYFESEVRMLCIACLFLVVGFGEYFQYYTRWSYSSYISGLMLSAFLPWSFFLIQEGKLKFKKSFFVFSFLSPIIFDLRSSLFLFFVGGLCFVFSLLREKDWKGAFRKKILFFLPGFLGLLLMVPALLNRLAPWLLNPNNKMHSPNSYRTGYYVWNHVNEGGFFSFFSFFFTKTVELIKFSLSPMALTDTVSSYFFVIVFFLGCFFSYRSRNSLRRFFAIFLAVGFFSLFVFNFLSLYPYGIPRYNGFLYFSIVMIFLFGLQDIFSYLRKKFSWSFFLPCLQIVCLCFSILLFFSYSKDRFLMKQKVVRIKSLLQKSSNGIFPFMRYESLVRWEFGGERKSIHPVSQKNKKNVLRLLKEKRKKKVLFISGASNLFDFPKEVKEAIKKNYKKKRVVRLFEVGRPYTRAYLLRHFLYNFSFILYEKN